MEVAITQDGNIDYSQAGWCITQGTPALFTNLATRLRLLKGEYLYDNTEGVDYPALMATPDINYITQSIDAELKKDPRVDYNDISYTHKHGVLNILVKVKSNESIV